MKHSLLASTLLFSLMGMAAPETAPVPAAAAPATVQAKPKPVAAKPKPAAAKPADPKATVTPVPRDQNWMVRHNLIKSRAEKGDIDVMFIGDSITHGWEGGGKAVWAKEIALLKAGNFGIGGDRTQHVLWRLDNGELPAVLQPKVAVIMIGTNNANSDSPEAIAAGITAIVDRLNAHNPKTKILLLAIFPRGATATDRLRKVNEATNAIIAKLDGTKNVHYLDIGAKFLQPDGVLTKEIMPDALHPQAKCYKIWSDAVVPEIKKLLAD
jgi:beta-glucosidase